MKRYFVPFFVCLFLIQTSFAQGFSSPLEYLEYFNQEFMQLQELQIEYSSLLVHSQSDIAEQKRQDLLAATQKLQHRFTNLKAYEDDKGIKSNAAEVTEIMLQLGTKDYQATADQNANCSDCFAAVLEQTVLTGKDIDALNKSMSDLVKRIEQFAKANEIKLEDNGDNHETLLGKIGRINSYIQELDLAVLEVQYANGDLVEAFNANDIDAAKAASKAMNKAAANANKRLKKIERIPEDASTLGFAQKMVDFYKDAPKDIYADLLSAFDNKGQIINKKVKLFNKSMERLNKTMYDYDVKYQTAKLNLQQRHIPKPKEKVIRS